MVSNEFVNDQGGGYEKDVLDSDNRGGYDPQRFGAYLGYRVDDLCKELVLLQAEQHFDEAAGSISEILFDIAFEAKRCGFNAPMQLASLTRAVVREWLSTRQSPDDHEIAVFRKQIVAMKLLADQLCGGDRAPLACNEPARRAAEEASAGLRVAAENPVAGVITPNDRLRQYRLMVATSNDMLAMIDKEYRYVIANPAYVRRFCDGTRDVVGQTVREVLGDDAFEKLVKPRVDLALTGKTVRFETWLALPGQEARYLDVSYEPYSDLEGRVTGMVVSARDITDRKHAEDALQNSEGRLRALTELSPSGIFRTDSDGNVVYMNNKSVDFVGESSGKNSGEELNPELMRNLHPDDRRRICAGWQRAVTDQQAFREEYRVLRAGGEVVWVICDAVPEMDSNGEYQGCIGTLTDISGLKEAQERGRQAASVFESTKDGIMITDGDARIISVNPAFEQITGYSGEDALGRNPNFLQSGRHGTEYYRKMWGELQEQGAWRGEVWNRRKDGSLYPEWLTISAIKNDEGETTNYVSVFSDISAIKKSEEQLAWLAYHDPLTKLPNRLLFSERMQHAIARAGRERTSLAVMFMDFDGFKHINDSLGHGVGDELLMQIARRLSGILREHDTVSRFGGDEFTILIENNTSPAEISIIAEKVVDCFRAAFSVDKQELFMSVSMGISLYPGDGSDADTLLRNADAAMYRAKERGGDLYEFYTSELTDSARERIAIETGIRNAIRNNELRLHYQPQFDSRSGRLLGAEALVRWFSEDLGQVSPGRFIPIAEESPVIHQLGSWVLEEACRQGMRWLQLGAESFRLAVNISGRQIQKRGFIEELADILARTGLPPTRLELEVTEGIAMRQGAAELLQQVRDMGISISIDDFGTGYSSLAYLKKLPVDRLKIDQSFVRDIGRHSNDDAIIRAVIALGHSLSLSVIAEGVEEEAQRRFLEAEGCDEIQGYLMGRPMPAEQFETLLQRNLVH